MDTFKPSWHNKEYSKQCYERLCSSSIEPMEVRYWFAPNVEKESRLVRDKFNLDNIIGECE